MKTATMILDEGRRDNPGVGWSHARVYRLDPPMGGHAHVAASAAMVIGRPEVYLFPCDAEGRFTSMLELGGSQKGTLDHDAVLRDAGYAIRMAGQ